MQQHQIRLKGPWDYSATSRSADGLNSAGLEAGSELCGTAKMPASWQQILGDFRGRAKFLRKFNRPSNLVEQDKVDLVFEGIGGRAEVSLNGQPLGQIDSTNGAQFEVGKLLQLHNLLEVSIVWDGPADQAGGLWGTVLLSIHSENVDW